MRFRKNGILLEIENLFVIILISFVFSGKIKMFLTSYFVCYLFIIFHELSHIVLASIFGKEIKRIKISVAGVCVSFNNVKLTNIKEIFIYLAGPMSNIGLAIIFQKIRFVYEINLFLAVLNLLPIYPLDGYNILNCILSMLNIGNLMTTIEKVFVAFLIFIAIIVFKYSLNPALAIFCLYIMLIKYVTKNHIK